MGQVPDFMRYDVSTRKLEINIPALLKHLNLPDTPEARDEATEVAQKFFRQQYPEATQDVHTWDYGTKRVFNPTRKNG